MLSLGEMSPMWRTKCTTNGYVSQFDGEWYYHFSQGGFRDIEWLEVRVDSAEQKALVRSALSNIRVPGVETDSGFRVFGYVTNDTYVEYI